MKILWGLIILEKPYTNEKRLGEDRGKNRTINHTNKTQYWIGVFFRTVTEQSSIPNKNNKNSQSVKISRKMSIFSPNYASPGQMKAEIEQLKEQIQREQELSYAQNETMKVMRDTVKNQSRETKYWRKQVETLRQENNNLQKEINTKDLTIKSLKSKVNKVLFKWKK